MQAWKIDFLDQLLPDKEDNGHYYILAYLMCETQEIFIVFSAMMSAVK